MPTRFLTYAPDQELLLLPRSLHEWRPAGHLAHDIGGRADALDLRTFFTR